MTLCASPQSARVRTRAIQDRPTRRPISTCGGSSMAKPTSIGTKARSTPLLLADAAPADLLLAAPGSNPETRKSRVHRGWGLPSRSAFVARYSFRQTFSGLPCLKIQSQKWKQAFEPPLFLHPFVHSCLLYTSDAADERS